MSKSHAITSEAGIEAVIGAPLEFVRAKITNQLDEIMMEFISHTPLIFVSTIDENGHVDISPKGDPPGFVKVTEDGALLIPERMGNKLTFGFRNILRNGEVGIIFVVPKQRETLRVKGRASLHNDPAVLEELAAMGKPALMYMWVEIDTCFFHCGKALIRSHLWQPDKWSAPDEAIGVKSFRKSMGGGKTEVDVTEELVEQAYKDELY